jgi:hypothetical protein
VGMRLKLMLRLRWWHSPPHSSTINIPIAILNSHRHPD